MTADNRTISEVGVYQVVDVDVEHNGIVLSTF